jgi:hypothetical protein
VHDANFSNNILDGSELFVAADSSELEMKFSESDSKEHPFLI